MSNITFSCPLCGKDLEVEDELRGQQAACPQCEQTIIIPLEMTDQPQERSSPLKMVMILLVIIALIVAIVAFVLIRMAGGSAS